MVELDERDNAYELVDRPETIKVYSGLYVNEAEDLDDDAVGEDLVDVVRLPNNKIMIMTIIYF